jgi:hypothetical protein
MGQAFGKLRIFLMVAQTSITGSDRAASMSFLVFIMIISRFFTSHIFLSNISVFAQRDKPAGHENASHPALPIFLFPLSFPSFNL